MNRTIRRYLLTEFKREKKTYKNKFFGMIFNMKYADINKIFRSIEKDSTLLKKLKSFLLPQSLRELCFNRMGLSENLNKEFLDEFCFNLIYLFSDEINCYLELKFKYEYYLFSEKYDEAFALLTQIENEVCVSIWSCCQKMTLTEKLKGLEEHKKLMNEYLKVTRQNVLVDTLIEFRSFFVETNTSYITYQNRVKELLNSIKGQEAMKSYFNYKLNMEEDFNLDVFLIAMQFESQYSIIDLYECFLCYVNVRAMSGEHLNIIKFENIIDYRLRNNILVNNYNKLEEYVKENVSYYTLLDLYSIGDYDLFLQNIKIYLAQKPQDFQAMLLFIKASINQSATIEFSFKIYSDIYNIYVMNEEINQSTLNMFNYLKEYLGTSWESKIKGFISRKITLKDNSKYNHISSLNDFRISPNFIKNFSNLNAKYEFLKAFDEACPITTNLYKYANAIIHILPEDMLDNIRKILFISEQYILNGDFKQAIELLQNLKTQLSLNDFYNLERINRKLVHAFTECKDFLNLIILIVESYLINENMIRRFDLEQIQSILKKNNHKVIKENIYFVVFTYICNKNDYKQQRIAYSNFMDTNCYNSLLDIISISADKKIIIFFLDKICSIHLLKRDIILNPSGNKADDIRIEILWTLIELDSTKRKIYYEEITSITKQKSIKDRIKQINQTRVYVDVDNIKKENEFFLRENFSRYLSVRDFDEDILTIDITSEEYLNDLRQIVNEMNEKIKVNPSFSQKILILKGIISKITEEFLFNEKYGLSTFLSSRIRHGYCKNQLKSVFQEYNLLSKKEKNDSNEYKINEYWDSLLPHNTQEGNKFKNSLSLFTLNIEKKIEEVKSIWLSIKYKEETNAFLNYSNCVGQILIIDRDNIVDFDEFFKEIIECLWNYTEILFSQLRDKIKTELMEYFLYELSKLETEIKTIKSNDLEKYVNQICANINLCKSQIGAKVVEFSNVFYKRDVCYKDFSMNDLIDTCIEINTKLNSNFEEIKFNRLITDNLLYKGEIFPYFVDIINILINNAMEHSGFYNNADLIIQLSIEPERDQDILEMIISKLNKKRIKPIENNFISIMIINNVSDDFDKKSTQKIVDNIFTNMRSTESLKKYTQSEGGTGLYKLYKTIQYNIYAPYIISYGIDDNKFRIQIHIGTNGITIGEEN